MTVLFPFFLQNQFFITSLFIDNVKNEIGQNLLWRIERAHRCDVYFLLSLPSLFEFYRINEKQCNMQVDTSR